jgi:hypothetical protein
MRFPNSKCTDGGRAINSFEPEWPQTLTGFAKKGHEFYEKELAPLGYKVRAQILNAAHRQSWSGCRVEVRIEKPYRAAEK